MTAARILYGLKNGLTKGLAKGLGLAACIYVTTRDHAFTQLMNGLDNCFLRFPFGYTCNNSTIWAPDSHLYGQASLDTWETLSPYLITLVGSTIFIDTAIKAYSYSPQRDPEEQPNSTSILKDIAKSCFYGTGVTYVSFVAYREALPVFESILPPSLELKWLPPVDAICFRSFNQEACETFETYSWVILSSFLIKGTIQTLINYNWNQLTDLTKHVINEASNGFKQGCKYGIGYALLSFYPTRDVLYGKYAAKLGHDWPAKFPRFGFDCALSPEYDDNLHGASVGDTIKFTLLYTGPGIILLSGMLNAGYRGFQAYYTLGPNKKMTIERSEELMTHFLEPSTNSQATFLKSRMAATIGLVTITSYGLSYGAFSIAREALTYKNRKDFISMDSSFRAANNELTHYFDILTPIAMSMSLFAVIGYKCKKGIRPDSGNELEKLNSIKVLT